MLRNNLLDGVYNEGACIRIVTRGNETLVTKAQIKTIDIVKNDTIRIDIGEGPLKNIYLRFDEVVYPTNFNEAFSLKDYIRDLLIQSGFSTESKQDTTIIELQQIKIVLENMNKTLQAGGTGGTGTPTKLPMREDESQPGIVYKGYALPNARTGDPLWAIQKISRIDNQIIYEWANGNENYENIWDNRYALSYFPSGFSQV